ncbi:MAG: hypothetical protein HPY75_15130, partial [Actinobacteria bacterium]|nr:hypothetical protein [Actinomycetota bacterium]
MDSGIAKFVMTVFEAMALLAIAWLVLRSNRERFLNLAFALFLFLLALWVLCGFLHCLADEPSERYVTLIFYAAYCTGALAAGALFLFGLSFLLGGRPSPGWLRLTASTSFLNAAFALSGLVIREAGFAHGRFAVSYGPLYVPFIASTTLLCGGGMFSIALKRSRSRGIDRTRGSYILMGFGIFIALAFVVAVVLPELTGNYGTSDLMYFLVLVPIAFTAYAILRYRLLDVRLAVRRSLAYLLTLLAFGAPLLASYLGFRSTIGSRPDLELATSLASLALAIVLAPAALHLSNRLASRVLFTGLYDEALLLNEVSALFASTANVKEGLIAATRIAAIRLGLAGLLVAIPDSSTRGKGNWVIGYDRSGAEGYGHCDTDADDSALFHLPDLLLSEDGGPMDPRSTVAGMEDVLAEMRERGLAACVPVRGPAGMAAVLLVGENVKRGALDPHDLDFLVQFAERAGIFIENYLLSSYLLMQLEELRDIYARLEESERLKTDIINVTSHELRTPLTIINGYTRVLLESHERIGEEERGRCLEYISSSCERLNAILDQFLTVSYFQRGTAQASAKPTDLEELFEELKSAFVPDQSKRIESEVRPSHLTVLTD